MKGKNIKRNTLNSKTADLLMDLTFLFLVLKASSNVLMNT